MTTEPEAIPADVLELAKEAHANFARSSVTDNLTTIIARAIMADRASRAPVDGTGWRAIETAPKDGTVIDLWFLGSGRRADCVWGEAISGQHPGNQVWLVDGLERNIVKGVPTHWMTRPAAPGTRPAPASLDAELVAAAKKFVDQVEVLLSADPDMPTAQSDYDDTEVALEAFRALLSKHGGDR